MRGRPRPHLSLAALAPPARLLAQTCLPTGQSGYSATAYCAESTNRRQLVVLTLLALVSLPPLPLPLQPYITHNDLHTRPVSSTIGPPPAAPTHRPPQHQQPHLIRTSRPSPPGRPPSLLARQEQQLGRRSRFKYRTRVNERGSRVSRRCGARLGRARAMQVVLEHGGVPHPRAVTVLDSPCD